MFIMKGDLLLYGYDCGLMDMIYGFIFVWL